MYGTPQPAPLARQDKPKNKKKILSGNKPRVSSSMNFKQSFAHRLHLTTARTQPSKTEIKQATLQVSAAEPSMSRVLESRQNHVKDIETAVGNVDWNEVILRLSHIFCVHFNFKTIFCYQEDDQMPDNQPTAVNSTTNQRLTIPNSENSVTSAVDVISAGGNDHSAIFQALQTITQQHVKQILAPLMDQLSSKNQVSWHFL